MRNRERLARLEAEVERQCELIMDLRKRLWMVEQGGVDLDSPEEIARRERLTREIVRNLSGGAHIDGEAPAKYDYEGAEVKRRERHREAFGSAHIDGSNLLVPGECRHETVFLKNPPDGWACRDCGELIDGSESEA